MSEPATPAIRVPDQRLVATIVILALLVRIWVATGLDLFRDEAYYWFWAIHPAWAYFDHSPGVAWLIALTRTLAGDTEIGVRLFGLLVPLAILLALFHTSRLLFGTSGAGKPPFSGTVLRPAP